MTNTMPGTSPVAPSQNEDVKASTPVVPVPPATPPAGVTPAMPPAVPPVSLPGASDQKSDLPAVSLPSAPGEKPTDTSKPAAEPAIKEVMEVNGDESKTPAIPTPVAKPLTPAAVPSAIPASAPPVMPASPAAPAASFAPSPVTPPKPDKVSTVNEPLKPPTPVAAANLVSPVVGAVPTVNVSTPAATGSSDNPKKAGGSRLKFIAPLMLLFFLVIGGGVAFFLSQRAQNIQNQASSATSKGIVESMTCSQIKGWACDSANYAQSLKIAVYYDEFKQENLVLVTDANVNHADAAESCGGTTNHGFVIDIPNDKIPAGQHQLIVKGIPVGAGNQLNTADMFSIPLASSVTSAVSCGSISQSCSLSFTAAPPPANSISCIKDTYLDALSNSSGQYSYTTKSTSFEPGEVVVFKVTMKNTGSQVQQFSLTDALTSENLEQLDFMDTSCGTYNASTRTITATTNPVSGGDEIVCGFRARVKSSVTQALVITNTANITAGTLSASCSAPITLDIPSVSPSPSPSPTPVPTPSPSPSPLPTPTPFTLTCGQSCTNNDQCVYDHTCYNGKCVLNTCGNNPALCSDDMCRATSCGSTCVTNTDCPEVHTCSSGVCKLTTCVDGSSTCTSDSCTVINPVTTTVTPPQTVAVVQPSPAVSCNQACNTNADCSNGNHICVDTASGRRCRLDSNVSSETCSPLGEAAVPTPRPVQLPVAGSNDILKALGIGGAAVILGIVGLLLL